MLMKLGRVLCQKRPSRLRTKSRRTLAVVTSVLVFVTATAHAQNLTDTQISLVSADLADAAQLR